MDVMLLQFQNKGKGFYPFSSTITRFLFQRNGETQCKADAVFSSFSSVSISSDRFNSEILPATISRRASYFTQNDTVLRGTDFHKGDQRTFTNDKLNFTVERKKIESQGSQRSLRGVFRPIFGKDLNLMFSFLGQVCGV